MTFALEHGSRWVGRPARRARRVARGEPPTRRCLGPHVGAAKGHVPRLAVARSPLIGRGEHDRHFAAAANRGQGDRELLETVFGDLGESRGLVDRLGGPPGRRDDEVTAQHRTGSADAPVAKQFEEACLGLELRAVYRGQPLISATILSASVKPWAKPFS